MMHGINCQLAPDLIYECEDLTLGNNVRIDEGVVIKGGKIIIGDNVHIRPRVQINVLNKLTIGHDSRIGYKWVINGYNVEIGHHLWCDDGDWYGEGIMGGGGCFEPNTHLHIGNYCHIGMQTYINAARPVWIGNNVAFGMRCCIYTHGAWPNVLEGYPAKFAPVTLEDNCWVPANITIMPGVTVGKGAMVASGSVLIQDVDPMIFVGGNPAQMIWPQIYPLNNEQKDAKIRQILSVWKELADIQYKRMAWSVHEKYIAASYNDKEDTHNLVYNSESFQLIIDSAVTFNFLTYTREGQPSAFSNHLQNIFRRWGIKFNMEEEA